MGHIRFYFSVFILLLSLNSYSQKQNPVVVYDHIIVYDTIHVYDTIFITDTVEIAKKTLPNEHKEIFFQKNNTAPNALLSTDTANLQWKLSLFDEKDTATFFINRILLSENLNNSDTMKNRALIMAASALFTQASLAQDVQVNAKSNNEEIVPTHTLDVGLVVATDVWGLAARYNKVLTKKWLVGVNTDIGGIYVPHKPNNDSVYSDPYKGVSGSLFATTTYYFCGNVTTDKWGFYGRFGLGVYAGKGGQSYHYVVPQYTYPNGSPQGVYSGSLPITTVYNYSEKGVAAQICIGTDFKVAKGKAFVDLTSNAVAYDIYTSDIKSTDPNSTFKSTYTAWGMQNLGLRIGYSIHLW